MTRRRSNRQPKRIVRIEKALEQLTGLFSEMRANQAMIQQEQTEASRDRLHLLGLIAQNSSEIKGLQTETKRMLDTLLNRGNEET